MTVLTVNMSKEENMYIAKCIEIKTVSQGYTKENALSNLKEATELYLEEFPSKEINLPLKFKVAEIVKA